MLYIDNPLLNDGLSFHSFIHPRLLPALAAFDICPCIKSCCPIVIKRDGDVRSEGQHYHLKGRDKGDSSSGTCLARGDEIRYVYSAIYTMCAFDIVGPNGIVS